MFCLCSFAAPHRAFEKRVNRLTGKKELPNELLLGVASGTGIAACYSCATIVPGLIESMGPGTIFSVACPHTSLFTLQAVTGFLFSLLHIIWSVYGFMAYSCRVFMLIPILVLSHLAASSFVCGLEVISAHTLHHFRCNITTAHNRRC